MYQDPILTYEEVSDYLDTVAEELPEGMYKELNGGILLQREALVSPQALHNDLFTLGTYTHAPGGLGRYITIYYGSFKNVCQGKSIEEQKATLRHVLLHEFTHHLENLAGVRDLEVEDEQFLENYYRQHKR